MESFKGIILGAEVWKLKATHGLPLDFVLDSLAATDMIFTLPDFLNAAEADGVNLTRLKRTLQTDMLSAYSRFPVFCKAVEKYLS